MGVPIADWVETVLKHPKTFKFEGLDGEGEDPRILATQDEQFMNNWMDKEWDYHEENLVAAIEGKPYDNYEPLENYAEELGRKVRALDDNAIEVRKLIEEIWCKETEDDRMREIVLRLEEIVGEHRREWAQEQCHCDMEWDSIKEMDLEYFLKEHPPIEIKDHASGGFVPLNEVVFLCPSCHRQPCDLFEMTDRRWSSFYCGLCGAQDAIDKGQTIIDFMAALDLKLFPWDAKRRASFMKIIYKPYFKKKESVRSAWFYDNIKLWSTIYGS